MNIEDYARELRKLVDVSDAVTADAILDLIKKEGWEPNLYSKEVDGDTLWACPIRQGIFQTVELNEATGQMGQAGSPTGEIAALEGLRNARFQPRLAEIWDFISSTDISEDEVKETAKQLSTVDGSMPLFLEASDESRNLYSWLTRIIEEWKPKNQEQRFTYQKLAIGFLASVLVIGLSECRSKPSTTVINNFFFSFNINSEDNPLE